MRSDPEVDVLSAKLAVIVSASEVDIDVSFLDHCYKRLVHDFKVFGNMAHMAYNRT